MEKEALLKFDEHNWSQIYDSDIDGKMEAQFIIYSRDQGSLFWAGIE